MDDFGQYDARPAVLWGQCYQIWNVQNPKEAIELQQVAQMLQQLAASRLVDIYADSEGKQFLQVSQWQERVREGCKRKWPNPEKLQQVAASCSNLLPPSSPPSPSPSPTPRSVRASVKIENAMEGAEGNGELDPIFVRDLMATYERKPGSRLTHLEESTLAEIVRERSRYRDEWDVIITLKRNEPRYFPQSLSKLLISWQETLDRAAVWVPAAKTPATLMDKELIALQKETERVIRSVP